MKPVAARPVSEEYVRVWAALRRVQAQLSYHPTHKGLLNDERHLSIELKKLEQ